MTTPKSVIGPQWVLALRYFARIYTAWAVFGAGAVFVIVMAPHAIATMWRHVTSAERTPLDMVAFVALGSVTVFAGCLILILLAALIRTTHAADFVGEIAESVAPRSRLLSRGEWVDGDDRRPGILSCRNDRFFFENADLTTAMNARTVEYELTDKLPNGQSVEFGKRVLMIRTGETSFFYVLDPADAKKWSEVLNLVVVRRRDTGTEERSVRDIAG